MIRFSSESLQFFVQLLEIGWHDYCLAKRTLVLLLHPHLNTVVVKVVADITAEWCYVLVVFKGAETNRTFVLTGNFKSTERNFGKGIHDFCL